MLNASPYLHGALQETRRSHLLSICGLDCAALHETERWAGRVAVPVARQGIARDCMQDAITAT